MFHKCYKYIKSSLTLYLVLLFCVNLPQNNKTPYDRPYIDS